MKDIEIIRKQIEEFTGDKRTSKYKHLKETLESLEKTLIEDKPHIDNPLVSKTSAEPLESLEKTLIEDKPHIDNPLVSKTSAEPFDRTIYDKVKSYTGRIPRKDVKWFFETYNKVFGTRRESCNCPGKIRRMINKLIKTYEKYLRNEEEKEM